MRKQQSIATRLIAVSSVCLWSESYNIGCRAHEIHDLISLSPQGREPVIEQTSKTGKELDTGVPLVIGYRLGRRLAPGFWDDCSSDRVGRKG